MPPEIVKLANVVQHYAWGSHEAIARLQGRAVPSARPEAELWIGDHPAGPSLVEVDGRQLPLPAWIEERRAEVLENESRHLPFLIKVLAAARSLSLQVHPDAALARAGFERESRARLPESERAYPDRAPKHEVLVALSRFEALCGLRSDDGVRRALRDLPELGSLTDPGDESPPLGLRLIGALASSTGRQRDALLEELDRFAASASEGFPALVARLREEHPDDALAAAPLLLNYVVLEPGDALVVAPGTVHTYLQGCGVEVMTRSDNVVRAGLTPKHVDVPTLMTVARAAAGPAEVLRAAPADEIEYDTRTDAFQVRSLSLAAEGPTPRSGGRVAVILCVAGAARVGTGSASVELEPGTAALVPASCDGFQLQGSGGTAKVFEVSSR